MTTSPAATPSASLRPLVAGPTSPAWARPLSSSRQENSGFGGRGVYKRRGLLKPPCQIKNRTLHRAYDSSLPTLPTPELSPFSLVFLFPTQHHFLKKTSRQKKKKSICLMWRKEKCNIHIWALLIVWFLYCTFYPPWVMLLFLYLTLFAFWNRRDQVCVLEKLFIIVTY